MNGRKRRPTTEDAGAATSVSSDSLARNLAKQDAGAAAPGDRQGARFETLFLRHYGRVHGILRRLLGSDEAAEDAAQEVFLRLYRQEAPPSDDVGLSCWLARVATNLGLNILRADRRQRNHLQHSAVLDHAEEPVREDRQDPARAALAEEETALVRAALDGMSERARSLLILRNSGLAYAEIAEALGVAPGSVGTLLARAERDFRKRYEALDRSAQG
jgi:RNA polymerase sigma-70 factor (ECF subfamily)